MILMIIFAKLFFTYRATLLADKKGSLETVFFRGKTLCSYEPKGEKKIFYTEIKFLIVENNPKDLLM